MKNKQNTKIIMGFSIGLTLLLAGVYVFAFRIVNAKQEQIAAVADELDDYLSRDGAINILKNIVRNTEEKREKLGSYFVGRDDLPEFAKKIESLGDISGASIEIKRFKEEGNIFSFDISSEGSFEDTMHLISLMESLPFKVEFKRAYVNTKKTVDGNNYSAVWDGNFGIDLVGFVGR